MNKILAALIVSSFTMGAFAATTAAPAAAASAVAAAPAAVAAPAAAAASATKPEVKKEDMAKKPKPHANKKVAADKPA